MTAGPTATSLPGAMAVRLTHRDTEQLDELLDRVSTIILDQVCWLVMRAVSA